MKKFSIFIFLSLICLGGLFLYQYLHFFDNNLHIVFCDVGAGDAILFRTPRHKNILVDAGPDKSILSCLNDHLPFWDKKIDLAVSTNPDTDYLTGFYYVLDRYNVLSFAIQRTANNTNTYQELSKIIASQQITTRRVSAGDRFKFPEGLVLKVESPPAGLKERSSLILKLTFKNFNLLLTGNAKAPALEEAVLQNKNKIDILQIPDQGSSTSLNNNIIDLLRPNLAVISVGANNTSGRPKDQILSILSKSGIKIARTDRDGDIEVLSNGKDWWIK